MTGYRNRSGNQENQSKTNLLRGDEWNRRRKFFRLALVTFLVMIVVGAGVGLLVH